MMSFPVFWYFCVITISVSPFAATEEGLLKWVFPKQIHAEPVCPAGTPGDTIQYDDDVTHTMGVLCKGSCGFVQKEVCDIRPDVIPCALGCKACMTDMALNELKYAEVNICQLFCHNDCTKSGGRCTLGTCAESQRVSTITCPFSWACNCCKEKYTGGGSTPGEQADPQYRTFDGFHFKYDGLSGCEYVFFQECLPLPSFTVLIRHHVIKQVMRMVVTEVSIVLEDIRVTLTENLIYANGHVQNPTIPWIHGNLTITKDGEGRMKVKLNSKFTLTWNGRGRAIPILDKSMFGKVCGLMGNADGDPYNDMQIPMPDGTLRATNEIDVFGDMWIVPGSCTI